MSGKPLMPFLPVLQRFRPVGAWIFRDMVEQRSIGANG